MIKQVNVRETRSKMPTHFHILKQDPVTPSLPVFPKKSEKAPAILTPSASASPQHRAVTSPHTRLDIPISSPPTPKNPTKVGRRKRSCHRRLRFVTPGLKCSRSNIRQHSSKRHQTSKNKYIPIRIDTKQELRDRTSHRSLLQDKVLQLSRPDLKEFMVQKKYIRRDCTAPLSVLQNIFLQSRAMGSIRIERE